MSHITESVIDAAILCNTLQPKRISGELRFKAGVPYVTEATSWAARSAFAESSP